MYIQGKSIQDRACNPNSCVCVFFQALFLYVLPLIFMSVAYYHIVKTLWRRNNMPGGQEELQSQHNGGGGGNNGVAMLSRSSTMRPLNRNNSNNDSSGNFRAGSGQTSSSFGQQQQNCSNRGLDNQLRTRRKVAKMLIAVVIMFFVNFFPVHLIPIVNVSH